MVLSDCLSRQNNDLSNEKYYNTENYLIQT